MSTVPVIRLYYVCIMEYHGIAALRSRLVQSLQPTRSINAICAIYNTVLNRNSAAVIKDRIWRTFVDNKSCFLLLGLVHFVVYFNCVLYLLPFGVIMID